LSIRRSESSHFFIFILIFILIFINSVILHTASFIMLLNGSLLLSFASLVLSAAVPSTLEARAGPYQTRIYESGSTFLNEDNGWWQLIE
jgi:hypothetical protein